MKTIKQCPFHTYEASVIMARPADHLYAVVCFHCNAHGPLATSKESAIAMWNTRSGSEYQDEIDALKAELKQLRESKHATS